MLLLNVLLVEVHRLVVLIFLIMLPLRLEEMLQELVLALRLILRLLVVLPRVHVVGLVEIISLPLL